MSNVDDSQATSRVFEQIRFWKMQEKDSTSVILQATPGLEAEYVHMLQAWQPLFAHTERFTSSYLNAQDSLDRSSDHSAASIGEDEARAVLQAAIQQSREYVDQLLQLASRSQAALGNPVARTVITHAVRESNYYLGTVGEELQETRAPSSTTTAQVPIGGHTLPPLPYPYNALEPYIDEATMRIHHDKHHQSYVDGLNKAEKELEAARKSGNFELVKHWERELAFNGAGHYLHTIFWDIMSPQGGGEATGPIAAQIKKDFGSFEAFKQQFTEAASKVEGSGWAILVWSPRSRRLEILMAEKHQNLSQWDAIPLLVLDVWEHAYYLKHQNKRPEYVKDWWNVVYWPAVNDRFEAARKLTWEPY
ncbi:Fe-Mn family superoxide dismutase [Paenibacillus sp. GCM10023252]|uniref:Fe-Mn family superoxide dismutase n=1 Tax=Paenibacillus sp. GCM10023252 TaxID=3252649 RepID=UPI0036220BEF